MAATIEDTLARFDPAKEGKYDPGQIVILFDNRIAKTSDDKFSTIQSYWTESLYRLGWPSLYKPILDPGYIRLIWYTVCAWAVLHLFHVRHNPHTSGFILRASV